MQKISRIYIGSYGADMAWFDGVVLDLTDPTTGVPTDTILNLENGGGKTTLLSFVFSCFDTPVERFLKHIQNKNHRFTQYFVRNGPPGIILIEWVMPPRTAGGTPYRLVLGQAVAVKAGVERDEADRVFFSFEACSALSFESVPAPKLNIAPVSNMLEMTRWVHDAHKLAPDFFHTRVQQDWHKHLRDERLIDIDMLKLQVNFSAQEGGIDTGFLTFNSEPEFVRKFLGLTLDESLASSVRQSVVNVCDKLRRKPHLQKCQVALTRLRTALLAFNEASTRFNQARESQEEVLTHGAVMARSLEAKAHKLREAEQKAAADREAHTALAKEKKCLAEQLDSQAITLKLLQLTRALEAATLHKELKQQDVACAKTTLHWTNAAKAHSEITGLENRLAELEASAAAASIELEPWREKVGIQGALLRHALHTAEQEQLGLASAATAKESEAQQNLVILAQDLRALNNTVRGLEAERAKIQAAEDSYRTVLTQLTHDGVLNEGESTEEALSRYAELVSDRRNKEQLSRSQAAELRGRERESRQQAQDAELVATRAQKDILPLEKRVADGEAEYEKLSQLQILRSVSETETADPDSPTLLSALERCKLAEERAVAQYAVQLSTLRASRSTILETGIAGGSRNVDEVVERLRALGVKSAAPFNTYLAKALPEAANARALVVSNPARFLGVSVASSELARARELVGQAVPLDAPVMVSVAALEPEMREEDRFVLPAADDAAFNREAAQKLLQQLDARLNKAQELNDKHALRQQEAVTAQERLRSYAQHFGNGELARAREEIKRLNAESSAALKRAQLCKEQTEEYAQRAEDARQSAEDYGRAAQSAETRLNEVRRFIVSHETDRSARLDRLQAISDMLFQEEERRTQLEKRQSETDILKHNAFQQQVRLKADATNIGKERLAVMYWNQDFPAWKQLQEQPQTLDALRTLYADAERLFSTESDKRLGLLSYKVDEVRKELRSRQQNFALTFAGVRPEDYEPYLAIQGFPGQLKKCEDALNQAQDALNSADRIEAAAESERKIFLKGHHPVEPATAQMQELIGSALEEELSHTLKSKQEAIDAERIARADSDRCKEAARETAEMARSTEQSLANLKASLELTELPDGTTEELGEVSAEQATALITEFNDRRRMSEIARKSASKTFDSLKAEAATPLLQEVEPDIASQLVRNEFEAACADSTRLLVGLNDRIDTTEESLAGMSKDFDACLGELLNLVNSAAMLLNSACNNKRVPPGAPYVGGKPILKMRARFQELGHDVRKQHLSNYLDELIDTNTVPAKGSELVADAMFRMHGKPLGLQMLKMVPDEALQYVAVNKIQNSGGEGVVMAMFLYMLINQLRAETLAKLKKAGGGPLILDNPFAKATTPVLWKAQRLLAQAMDVQLVFATALPDYNTVGEFGRFVRLRKTGKNSKTGRWHLETADFMLNEQHRPNEAAA